MHYQPTQLIHLHGNVGYYQLTISF